MATKPQQSEFEARDREASILDYLDMLLRNLWSDLEAAGGVNVDPKTPGGVAGADLHRGLSLAQELLAELTALADRPRRKIAGDPDA
ncbi:hypothetical protein NRB_02170 [Novosphingobium sp. 11B]